VFWKRVLLVGLVASFGVLLVDGVPSDVNVEIGDSGTDGVVTANTAVCDGTCVASPTGTLGDEPDTCTGDGGATRIVCEES
jgi:hypothetical protein